MKDFGMIRNLIELRTTLEEILFVLVLYKRKLNESDSFLSLVDSLKNTHLNIDIFIYDNSPSTMLKEELTDKNCNIYYIHDHSNPGVSKAYNEGFKLGKKLNKKWLLLLDQDTEFPEDALLKYCTAVQDYNKNSLFAPILVSENGAIHSPCNYFFKSGYPMQSVETGLVKCKKKSILNSGLLINIDTFDQVGGYNEKIKLDFSDFDFFNRYSKIYEYFYIVEIKCIHPLATAEDDDVNRKLKRFESYCESIKHLAELDLDTLVLLCKTLARACKLSIKFRDVKFIYIFASRLINPYLP